MRRFLSRLVSGPLLLLLASSAPAVLTGDQEPPPRVADASYNAGIAAWQAEDWQAVIEHMVGVLERRPWHDNAHNLMGFAFRKLGDYDRALAHYRKALALNPYHRGALAYLGQAYLELGRPAQAAVMLEQLAKLCGGAAPDCEEWRVLKAAIDGYDPATRGQSRSRPNGWSSLSAEEAAALDTASTRVSEVGYYRASVSSKLDPITINRIHSWVLHLETLAGQPVDDADITVDGGMPEHNHGLPTAPQITRYLGDGDYLLEGMKFQMSGWWEVSFTIDAGGRSDTVTFNLVL